jgi:TonB family protein
MIPRLVIGFVPALLLALAGQPLDASPAPPPPAPPQAAEPTGVLTRPPALLEFVPAPYPPEAEGAGVSGAVLLGVVIGADGAVTEVKVVDPGPHPSFAPAAEAAVRKFRFQPAEIDGKPASVEIEYRYEFVLQRKPPAAPPEAPVLLAGVVIERGTRRPLPGVVIEAGGVSAETDATGHFALRGLTPGEQRVRIVSPDHERLEVKETIAADVAVEVEYRLRRRHYDPYEAVVRGERPRREVAVRTLEVEEVRTVAGTQGDVIKVIQNLPGVARSPFGIGLLVVRGSDPADTAVFLDGVPVPVVYHFGGLTSVVSSDMIDALDFYPGNFGTRFGRAKGGVVEIRTRDPKDTFHGLAQVDLYDGRAQVEGPLAGGAFAASVRRSWVDAVLRVALPRVAPEAADALRIAPRYYDYQARYSRPLAGGTLSVLAFGSDDKLDFVQNPDQPGSPSFFLGTLFHRGALRWTAARGALRNDLVLYGGWDGFDVLQGSAFGVRTGITSLGIRETARWRLSDALTLEGGIDSLARRFRYSLYVPKQDAPGNTGDSGEGSAVVVGEQATGSWLSPGAWLEAEWQPTAGVRLVGGLRADHDSRLRTARVWLDPRASVFWEPRAGTLLSAAAGLFGKAPEPGEMTKLFGNPDLVPSRAAHYSVGLRQALPWGTSLEATAFYKSLWDLTTAARPTEPGQPPPNLSSRGRGEAIGAEILLRKELSRGLFGWLSYTWSRATRLDDPSVPGWPAWHLFDLDQTHNLTLVLSYRLPHDWIVGTRVRAVSGNPYTPWVGHVLDADTGRYQCIPSPDIYSRRLDPFFQADARVDKRWVFPGWMMAIYLDVQNATNRSNAEFRVPTYDCSGQVAIPGLPVFPSIGLRGEW